MENCLVTKLSVSVPDPNHELQYFGGVIVEILNENPSYGFGDTGVFSIHGATELTFVDKNARFGENGEGGFTLSPAGNSFKFKPLNNSDPYGTPYRVLVKGSTDTLQNIYKVNINDLCKYTSVLNQISMCRPQFTEGDASLGTFGAILVFHSTIEICTPLIVFNCTTQNTSSDVDINLAHFANNNVLRTFKPSRGCPYYGDIVNIASAALQSVDFGYYTGQENMTGQQGVYGEITQLAAAMSSRASGTCSITINANCHTITLNGTEKTGSVTIRFGSSMQDPSAAETAQNYQIS